MSAPNLTDDDMLNVPELGDILTLKSTVFKSLTGKIIFRDDRLIRIQPIDASDRAYDLGLDADDGDFLKENGVTECIIHSKRDDPHFSIQLGVSPGELLEFFTNAGQVVAVPGVVAKINADDENDSIQLADGRILDFLFVGAPAPIQVVRVSAAASGEEQSEQEKSQEGQEQSQEGQEQEQLPEKYDISFLDGLLPAAMMEEIPTAERTYPETIQREDMYLDLLKSYPEAKQKSPAVLHSIERETALLLALKNAVIATNEKGEMSPYTKSADSLKDILEGLKAPVSSLVPVLAIKRILYTDESEGAEADEVSDDIQAQVEFKDWLMTELRSLRSSANYTAGQEGGAGAQVSNLLYTYLSDVLYREGAVFAPSAAASPGMEVAADQEVLRTVLPPEPALGYSQFSAESELNATFVGPITKRLHRVISAMKSRSGTVIAPGDPGTATNYLLFKSSVGAAYRPTKFSGSVCEDIRAASVVNGLPSIETVTNDARAYNPNGIQVIAATAAAEGLDASQINTADWITDNLKSSVHPSDMLGSASIGVNRVLDSIGLRSYEWTPEVGAAIWGQVAVAQELYMQLFARYKASVPAPTPYTASSAIAEDSILYKKTMEVPELAALIQGQQSSDLVLAQKVFSRAEGTAARLLYLGTSDRHPLLEPTKRVYLSELHRAAVKFRLVNSSDLKAAPTLNKCPHTRDMDMLRSLMAGGSGSSGSESPKFIPVLQKILTQYQGGRDNNWVNCKVCDGHLICIHEVMMLYERTHPGRAAALHKEILMEYGGAAFSGRYVCRFCGVAISEFEYDTNLEFDDEGRPLVGRNVLEAEEKTVEDELDAILNVSAKKKNLAFENPIQTGLYDLTRVMVQTAGFTFDEATYTKIVMFSYGFLISELPPKDRYEQMIAKKKIKPTYESFKATNEVAVTAAYVLCMIHSMNPMPEIMFPFAGCEYKRGGFPISTDDATVLGAMEYFVCVIANINRNTEPWNLCMWASDSSPDKRKEMVRNWIMNMLGTKDLRVMAATARSDYAALVEASQSNATSKDKIPIHFRPTPSSKPAHFDAEVMVNPDRVLETASTGSVATVEPVVNQRLYQLACNSVAAAHAAATETGIISATSPRSDSNCCFVSLQKVRDGSMSLFNSAAVEDEIAVLGAAKTVLEKRDPCQQSNGAHLYVHWSVPDAVVPTAVKPDASYFKLFMRTCFRGPRLGLTHEFGQRGSVYQCRHCNFKLNVDPLVLMSDLNDEELANNNRKGGAPVLVVQGLARESLKSNGIDINAESFKELLSAVRSKRMVAPFVEPKRFDSADIFDTLNRLVNTDLPFIQARNVDWQLIVEIMGPLLVRADEPTEDARAIIWAPFVSRYDSLRAGIIDILDGRQGRGGVKKVSAEVEEVLAAVDRLTEEPVFQGPSEINKHWVVGLERLAQSFSEMVFGVGTWFGQNVANAKPIQNYLFGGKKWFGKKISKKHTEKFEAMIQNVLGANTDTNKELGRSELRGPSSDITHRLSIYLGRIVLFWSSSMSAFSVPGVSVEELRYILRWLVLSSMETLLLTQSPLYVGIPRDAERSQIQRILLGWTKKVFLEGQRQFNLFGLTAAEIQMAILDAREKEKLSVIKEIDDEKDPDLRAIAMVQKSLKIGRWAIGTAKNLTSYNAEFQDFLQEQRNRAGLVEDGIMTAAKAQKKEDALGFDMSNVENSAYDTGEVEHEDADGDE